jgi:hypothetical protein
MVAYNMMAQYGGLQYGGFAEWWLTVWRPAIWNTTIQNKKGELTFYWGLPEATICKAVVLQSAMVGVLQSNL